uniref:Uncharacterized protein n=1 Tax=Physcomitrium patens TaxID=3218 RepID=A0A2K1IA33_PHYPA|nr:hypothetical protein PHYPA_030702 [Physcomitrium patens]
MVPLVVVVVAASFLCLERRPGRPCLPILRVLLPFSRISLSSISAGSCFWGYATSSLKMPDGSEEETQR